MKSQSARDAARKHAARVRAEGASTARGRKRRLHSKVAKIKKRARELGVPCDLTHKDIEAPEKCPVLGIPLGYESTDQTPSIDRINQTGGYTKDNIRVVSFRANTLRNNAHWSELLAVALDSLQLERGEKLKQECEAALLRVLEPAIEK